ncbi:MAG: hypothetical protein KME26_13745 [Oscillatoria princeps RMCB-10]|nr:hypothetical protein [Oscillatoria princeps RMCB-10]
MLSLPQNVAAVKASRAGGAIAARPQLREVRSHPISPGMPGWMDARILHARILHARIADWGLRIGD